MSLVLDPRLRLARGDLAAARLEGVVDAPRYVQITSCKVRVACVPLRRAAQDGAEQLDQLLFGETFEVMERVGGFALGQARRDGYVGFLSEAALAPCGAAPTHRVRALRTCVLAEPSVKAPCLAMLSMNALARVTATDGAFACIDGLGWVAADHLSGFQDWADDPVSVAELYLGAPYLWGGRDSLGLDCSGLVQQALYACGRFAPRDSDQQQALGNPLAPGQALHGLRRGDLVFWRGHVGLMLDALHLLHANAHHMAVASEPLAEAASRILTAGGGDPIAFRRLETALARDPAARVAAE